MGRAVRDCGDTCQSGLVAGLAEITSSREARSREVPMREGQFFARAIEPRRGCRFLAKAIRRQGAVHQAGLAARARSHSGAGGRSGLMPGGAGPE